MLAQVSEKLGAAAHQHLRKPQVTCLAAHAQLALLSLRQHFEQVGGEPHALCVANAGEHLVQPVKNDQSAVVYHVQHVLVGVGLAAGMQIAVAQAVLNGFFKRGDVAGGGLPIGVVAAGGNAFDLAQVEVERGGQCLVQAFVVLLFQVAGQRLAMGGFAHAVFTQQGVKRRRGGVCQPLQQVVKRDDFGGLVLGALIAFIAWANVVKRD